jgi:hypothetical protein
MKKYFKKQKKTMNQFFSIKRAYIFCNDVAKKFWLFQAKLSKYRSREFEQPCIFLKCFFGIRRSNERPIQK